MLFISMRCHSFHNIYMNLQEKTFSRKFCDIRKIMQGKLLQQEMQKLDITSKCELLFRFMWYNFRIITLCIVTLLLLFWVVLWEFKVLDTFSGIMMALYFSSFLLFVLKIFYVVEFFFEVWGLFWETVITLALLCVLFNWRPLSVLVIHWALVHD